MATTKLLVEVDKDAMKELEYLIALHRQHGAICQLGSVAELIDMVLMAVADGSRRPGAWQRSILENLGLVAETDEHHIYRNFYGAPNGSEEQHLSLGGGLYSLRTND